MLTKLGLNKFFNKLNINSNYCWFPFIVPSGSCKFKKITSVSDVGIFNNVRIDYVDIVGIGGSGDGLERAGFYTVSVLENLNFYKSKSDKSVKDNDMSDKNPCEKKSSIGDTFDKVFEYQGDRFIFYEGC